MKVTLLRKTKTHHRSKSKISQGLILQVNFETEARSLAMRLAKRGCWRPCYSDKYFYLFYVFL